MEDTYAVLEDLRLNHPDSKLRSEAGYAVETLKVKEKVVEQKPRGIAVEIAKPEIDKAIIKDEFEVSDKSLSEFVNLITPNETDLKDVLEGLGLEHLIKKKKKRTLSLPALQYML
jgi:hypothetical protein